MRRRVLASAFAVLVVAACSGDDPGIETSTSSGAPGAGQVIEIRAFDNTFRPDSVEVPLGAEVVFVNSGRTEHDVIPADQRPSDELKWGVGADDFAPGDEYRVIFDQPGTYPYYCSIHGTSTAGMVGTIVVTG